MATKTISITEEAYERLLAKRKGNESFSQIIVRITNKVRLLDFAGILNDEESKVLMNEINLGRALSKIRSDKRLQK